MRRPLAQYGAILALLWPTAAPAGENTVGAGQATPPLQVLIRPRPEISDDPGAAEADSPPVTDFRDAYVVLPDGRFMSFADWTTGVVAALSGNAAGSDFQRRRARPAGVTGRRSVHVAVLRQAQDEPL